MSPKEHTIISIFGPDGVGKSTVARRFQELGFEVFSGTGVASWPDQSWHKQLLASGINDTTENNDEHFKEKIRRAHELARSIESRRGVVIDSDPLHKTLMHDYLHSKDPWLLEKRFDELAATAQLSGLNARIHLHLKVSEDLDEITSARILQERIISRGERAPFDPETVAASARMIEAYELIAAILRRNGQHVISLSTSLPISDQDIAKIITS